MEKSRSISIARTRYRDPVEFNAALFDQHLAKSYPFFFTPSFLARYTTRESATAGVHFSNVPSCPSFASYERATMPKLRCIRCMEQRKSCDGDQPSCDQCSSLKSGRVECVYPDRYYSRREWLEKKQASKLRASKGLSKGIGDLGRRTDTNMMEHDDFAELPLDPRLMSGVSASEARRPQTLAGPASHYDALTRTPALRGGDIQSSTLGHEQSPTALAYSPVPYPVTAMPQTPEQGPQRLRYASFSKADGHDDSRQLERARLESYSSSTPTTQTMFTGPVYGFNTQTQTPALNSAGYQSTIVVQSVSAGIQNGQYTQPQQCFQPPLSLETPTPESIGRNLANSLDRNAPRHCGGVLDGLPDWSQASLEDDTDWAAVNDGDLEEMAKWLDQEMKKMQRNGDA